MLQGEQRDIQKLRNQKHLGERCEVMVEGKNEVREQCIGRTSQNKILNFTAPEGATCKPGTTYL